MGGLCLQATHFDTLYYTEAESMCRKWPQNVCAGMLANVCNSLNATRIGTLLVFGVGYIRAYYSRQEQRQPIARYCLYLPASMTGHTRQEKVVVSYSVWFQCQPSVNGPCLVWVRFRPSIPISVHVSAGELYK